MSMKNYVLSRAMEPVILVAEMHGVDEAELVRGLSFDHQACRKSLHLRLPWDELVIYLSRWEKAVGEDFTDDLKSVLKESGTLNVFFQLGGLFASARSYFWIANHFVAPMVFPVMDLEVEELGTHGCRMVATLPKHLEGSTTYFRISHALMEVGPTMLGLQAARIDLECSPHRAVYTVTYPPAPGLKERVRRAVDVALSGRLFMDELSQQHESLMESYEALRSSEESFRRLVEKSPEGIVIYDDDGIVFANDALAGLLGWGAGEELICRPINSLARDPEAFSAELMLGRDKTYVEALTLVRKDGAFIQAEASSFQSTFKGMKVRISIVRDVTFQNEVMARAVDIDRLITMGTLAAGVAHEINNPITIAQANLGFIEDFLNGVLEHRDVGDAAEAADVRAALEGCARGLNRAQTITRELKTVGRTAREDMESGDLREAVDSSLQWIRSDLKDRAKIVTNLEPCGAVLTNLPRVGQVVLNLLINAGHAMEQGGPEENEVHISTYRKGEYAYIEVRDTGCGIPEQNLKRIYDPFFTTKPAGAGTGLGLFVSRSIMERLGGTLEIESVEGQGTRAVIALPLQGDGESPA